MLSSAFITSHSEWFKWFHDDKQCCSCKQLHKTRRTFTELRCHWTEWFTKTTRRLLTYSQQSSTVRSYLAFFLSCWGWVITVQFCCNVHYMLNSMASWSAECRCSTALDIVCVSVHKNWSVCDVCCLFWQAVVVAELAIIVVVQLWNHSLNVNWLSEQTSRLTIASK